MLKEWAISVNNQYFFVNRFANIKEKDNGSIIECNLFKIQCQTERNCSEYIIIDIQADQAKSTESQTHAVVLRISIEKEKNYLKMAMINENDTGLKKEQRRELGDEEKKEKDANELWLHGLVV